MNDAEKSKLEQELKKAAPVLGRLSEGPSPLPDNVRARLNAALDKKFPPAAQPATESADPTPARRKVVEREKPEPSWLEVWRWWIGLATATAAVVLIVVLNRPGPNLPPVIQVAMLDSIGTVRGNGEKPMEVLQRQWKDAKPEEFADVAKLKNWQESWPAGSTQTVVKVIYDRDAGELRLFVRKNEGTAIEKVFPVKEERDLSKLIVEAQVIINGMRD